MDDNKNNKNEEEQENDDDEHYSLDDLRQMGNHQFSIGNYEEAIILYSNAIEMADSIKNHDAFIINLCNRSACYYQMNEYEYAQLDAHQAVFVISSSGRSTITKPNLKAYYRLIKCQIALKSFTNAMDTIQSALDILNNGMDDDDEQNPTSKQRQLKAFKELKKEAQLGEREVTQEQQEQQEESTTTSIKLALRNMSIREFIRGTELGYGNFSEIIICKHRITNESFALKIIPKKKATELAKRQHPNVYNEIQMERRILMERLSKSHENIIKMYHAFQDYTSLYYLMDLHYTDDGGPFAGNDGNDLWSQTRYRKHMVGCHRSQAKVWLAEIIDAMEHMHKHGIVHRDLKPENILLNKSGHVVVIDFGTAKDLLEVDLNGPEFVGTPDFMSPEAVMGSAGPKAMEKDRQDGKVGADHTADLWALGAIAYQLHSGQTPFSCPSQYLTFLRIQRKPFSHQNLTRPWGIADDDAWDFIRSLMEKEPSKRLGADCFELKVGNLKRSIITKDGGYDTLRQHAYFTRQPCDGSSSTTTTNDDDDNTKQHNNNYRDLPLPSNYKNVTPIPTLRDLCIRKCIDLVIQDSKDFVLCDEHPPGDGSLKHDMMLLDKRDRLSVMHLMDRLHLLIQNPTIYRRFFDSILSYRLDEKVRIGTRDYVGLTRMTDNHGQFPRGSGNDHQDQFAKEPIQPNPVHLVLITNPLLVKEIHLNLTIEKRKVYLKQFKKCIATMNRKRPKVVICNGNYVDESCRKLLARINDSIPVVIVGGGANEGNEKDNPPPPYFTFWHSGCQFLAITTRQSLDENSNQMRWIREELEQVRMAKHHLFIIVDDDPRILPLRVLKTLTRGRAHMIMGIMKNDIIVVDEDDEKNDTTIDTPATSFEYKIGYEANETDDDGASIKSTDSVEDSNDEWISIIAGSQTNGLRTITILDWDRWETNFEEIQG